MRRALLALLLSTGCGGTPFAHRCVAGLADGGCAARVECTLPTCPAGTREATPADLQRCEKVGFCK